jgi:hypothetical protein
VLHQKSYSHEPDRCFKHPAMMGAAGERAGHELQCGSYTTLGCPPTTIPKEDT